MPYLIHIRGFFFSVTDKNSNELRRSSMILTCMIDATFDIIWK